MSSGDIPPAEGTIGAQTITGAAAVTLTISNARLRAIEWATLTVSGGACYLAFGRVATALDFDFELGGAGTGFGSNLTGDVRPGAKASSGQLLIASVLKRTGADFTISGSIRGPLVRN